MVIIMANKTTKKENFGVIANILKEMGREDLEQVMLHEIELIENKASRAKATKNQIANEGIKATILKTFENATKPMTITELISTTPELAEYTNQKVSALVSQLLVKNGGTVERLQEGKVARFTIAPEE